MTAIRWLLDTSAGARRHIPAVRDSLRRYVEAGDELCLSVPASLELLRGPRGGAVGAERDALRGTFDVVPFAADTGMLAADAMVRLASGAADSHRVPLADLLTAIHADEGGLGILHLDRHFDVLASTLEFRSQTVCDAGSLPVERESPAATQRELRRTLNRLLSQLPVARAEELLAEFIARAQTSG